MKIQKSLLKGAWLCFFIMNSIGFAVMSASGAGPKAVIEQTLFKFSPVIAGSEVTHIFLVSNKGDAVLNIPGIYTD